MIAWRDKVSRARTSQVQTYHNDLHVPFLTFFKDGAYNMNQFPRTVARPGTKMYPPFYLLVHLNKDVKASKVELLEGSDDMDRPKGPNSNNITLVLFGD